MAKHTQVTDLLVTIIGSFEESSACFPHSSQQVSWVMTYEKTSCLANQAQGAFVHSDGARASICLFGRKSICSE